MRPLEDAVVGFGSNLGDSVQTCTEAIRCLSRQEGIVITRVSSFYLTEPVGFTRQDWFVNGVVILRTSMDPASLLAVLLGLETAFGRQRLERWGPRTLDLDLLFFGDQVIDTPELVVPHPRIPQRRFVLVPLVEIDPGRVHPVLLKTGVELLRDLRSPEDEQQMQRIGAPCFVS